MQHYYREHSRIVFIKWTVMRPPQEVEAEERWSIAALLMIYSSQGTNLLISAASYSKQKWHMKEEEGRVNSDLSCHELSKTRWEGQSGDDQRHHSREDEPAGGNKIMVL